MDKVAKALLSNGNIIEYLESVNPPRGGMKYTYFTPDKKYVVQFFNDPSDVNQETKDRIDAIISKYNPTLSQEDGGANGNDEKTSSYFSKRFCWPVGIVVKPEFGIVCPTYPKHYFFDDYASQLINLKGKDKKSNWFTNKNRKYLNSNELGDFRSMLKLSILLSRSIRRMHQAGLAHSDLSCNNVLIDPKSGDCVIIDIDSLVVPGRFPPEVIGTRGYIAPEVLATMGLDRKNRKYPSVYTDLHSMAVLIYEYLLFRHPLIGPKIYSNNSEEDDHLCLVKMATFIENPNDTSNRPLELKITIKDLGPYLENLFMRAFVDGLHNPELRPAAIEWERGLIKTWDLIHSCSNPYCDQKFFVLHDVENPTCPFCKTTIKNDYIIKLKLKARRRGQNGYWYDASEIIAEQNTPLCKWHLYSGIFPDEKSSDRTVQAYITKKDNRYILVNQKIKGLYTSTGNIIPIGYAIVLKENLMLKISNDTNGLLIEVSMKKYIKGENV